MLRDKTKVRPIRVFRALGPISPCTITLTECRSPLTKTDHNLNIARIPIWRVYMKGC